VEKRRGSGSDDDKKMSMARQMSQVYNRDVRDVGGEIGSSCLLRNHVAVSLPSCFRSITLIYNHNIISFLVKSYRHPMSLLYLAIPLYIRPSASGHCTTRGKINGEDSSQTHGMKKYLCRLRSAIIAHYKPFAETDLCSSFIYQHNL
jgi:hypothetical protein